MSLLAITLWLLFFFSSSVVHSGAQGSSRGSLGDGICATSVVVHGYKCQELQVTTADGYILSVQRIPEGRSGNGNNNNNKKQPVIIQHGILVDGMTWLLNGPDQNLPLILADNGFDVWISNTRGTRFSRRHISLDPSTPAYWNWSWEELGRYDLRAVVEYVSNQTGQKIHYIGHSQGTLIALTAFSEGKLVNKLKSAALLSPVAYLSHMTTELLNVAASYGGHLMIKFILRNNDSCKMIYDGHQQFLKIATVILRRLCEIAAKRQPTAHITAVKGWGRNQADI
ncbi:triacylglycerol lipase 2-like [Arachis ipaensis]|uniref:triacylglycerol lipase 2-like n=1 Tax=Arachis ipaensis TaxID=130454 RepID=UPI0007AFCAFF|nr:triacylglycerol lipase 2-like [Arachis ipaensis]